MSSEEDTRGNGTGHPRSFLSEILKRKEAIVTKSSRARGREATPCPPLIHLMVCAKKQTALQLLIRRGDKKVNNWGSRAAIHLPAVPSLSSGLPSFDIKDFPVPHHGPTFKQAALEAPEGGLLV
ncbi:hypothetical protein CDAR_78451 [Caerostris darwini]|uniref:Uncharacterized protein n=1 Tax=Caerostris darwini TaxID=1538125 RepID=A0AAV4SFL4_9ARAC|nr:hypothetical protein CDAR_78451 [Caerostris darwini]